MIDRAPGQSSYCPPLYHSLHTVGVNHLIARLFTTVCTLLVSIILLPASLPQSAHCWCPSSYCPPLYHSLLVSEQALTSSGCTTMVVRRGNDFLSSAAAVTGGGAADAASWGITCIRICVPASPSASASST